MNYLSTRTLLIITACAFSLTSCVRSRDETWDDTKTAGRHMYRGFASLGGKHGDSRQIRSRDEFIRFDEAWAYEDMDQDLDFVPLAQENNEVAMVNVSKAQPKNSPGDPNSHIPGIHAFSSPSENSEYKDIFTTIFFPLNSNLIKDPQSLSKVQTIAEYLKEHKDVYVFIEGHCCERGADAYNLALGSKRANTVREQLIKEGVSADQIFSVSYGKERPAVKGSHEDALKKNRRAEFKVYKHA